MDAREAIKAQRRAAHAAGGDPYGVRTVAGARAAYLHDEIDLLEFERRVDLFLSGKPVAIIAEYAPEIIIRRGGGYLRRRITPS